MLPGDDMFVFSTSNFLNLRLTYDPVWLLNMMSIGHSLLSSLSFTRLQFNSLVDLGEVVTADYLSRDFIIYVFRQVIYTEPELNV